MVSGESDTKETRMEERKEEEEGRKERRKKKKKSRWEDDGVSGVWRKYRREW